MASIENRSHYHVAVKNRDDLTKTFAYSSRKKADAYCKSLEAQKLKPKLTRLDDKYIIRVRKRGHEDQVFSESSLKEAELVKAKFKIEHSQSLFINYAIGLKTTLADLLIRYLWEEAPRNKSFEIDAYKINAMLEDAGLPRQSIAAIVAAHINPCPKVRNMKIRKETGVKMRTSPYSATRFIRKPIAQISADDFNTYCDERCHSVMPATVDREIDIFSAVCNVAVTRWGIYVQRDPMQGVRRPKYFNERERRLHGGEESVLLAAAHREDKALAIRKRLAELMSDSRQAATQGRTHYKRGQIHKLCLPVAQETYTHVPWFETFVQFQLMTGARRSESLSLLWSNVDLDRQTAYLPETKNGRPRKLPIRSDLVAMLRKLPRITERVFDISGDTLTKAWQRICAYAGFTGENELHIHDLRHEAISRVAEAGSNTPGGFSLIDLQHFSGHLDVRMLLRYAHLCSQSLAQRLDAAFAKKDGETAHRGRRRLAKEAGITMREVVKESTRTEQSNTGGILNFVKRSRGDSLEPTSRNTAQLPQSI